MGEQEKQLRLDENPTPEEESEDFSTTDENKRALENSHQLELLKGEQGPIGALIGCSDSSLSIAFVLLILGFIGIVVSVIGMAWQPDSFGNLAEKLITFELTIAGYVMGKRESS